MIVESIRFGFNNILNKKVLVFTLFLYIPLMFFLTILLFVLEQKLWLILSIGFSFLYYILIFGSLILLSNEIVRKRKEVSYKRILKTMVNLYPSFLVVNLLLNIIILSIFAPSIVLSVFLTISFQNLIYWLVVFSFNLIIGFYIILRLVLTPYIYLLDKKDIVSSFKNSWKITKGNVVRLFLIYFVGTLIIFLVGGFFMGIANFAFKNAILLNIVSIIIQVFIIIYQVFSISFAYAKYLKKFSNRIKK